MVPRSRRNDRSALQGTELRPCRRQTAAIMVKSGLKPYRARDDAWRGRDAKPSFPVDRLRIEHPVRVHERQSRFALGGVDLAVETGVPAGVTRRAGLLD